MPRGKIYNKRRAEQLRDFAGLRFGNITPTDIDAVIDFGNKMFVFVEAKANGATLPYGQQLALERLCDGVRQTAVVLVISHSTPADQAIDFASAVVERAYYRGKWYTYVSPITCRACVEVFLQSAELDEYL